MTVRLHNTLRVANSHVPNERQKPKTKKHIIAASKEHANQVIGGRGVQTIANG